MTSEVPERWWRRKGWLGLLGFAVLLYPLLLVGSSNVGSSVGLSRDVNAKQALARALSYAADPRLPVARGNDGDLATPALDGNLVALQLGDAGGATAGSPSSVPASGSTPTATPAGNGAGPPAVAPAAAPPPPVAPPPTAAKPPVAPPPPPPPPPPAPKPAGGGTFHGTVVDPQGNPTAGTLTVYFNLRPVTTVVTGPNGRFAIRGLTGGKLYGYIVTAPGFSPGAGLFTPDNSGNYTTNPQLHSPAGRSIGVSDQLISAGGDWEGIRKR